MTLKSCDRFSPLPTDGDTISLNFQSAHCWHRVLSPATMMTSQIQRLFDPILRPRQSLMFSRNRWESSSFTHFLTQQLNQKSYCFLRNCPLWYQYLLFSSFGKNFHWNKHSRTDSRLGTFKIRKIVKFNSILRFIFLSSIFCWLYSICWIDKINLRIWSLS